MRNYFGGAVNFDDLVNNKMLSDFNHVTIRVEYEAHKFYEGYWGDIPIRTYLLLKNSLIKRIEFNGGNIEVWLYKEVTK